MGMAPMKPTIVNPQSFDATRLRPAQLCWRKALYGQVYGLERVRMFETHLNFGRVMHSAFERYDHVVMEGGKDAAEKATRAALHVALAESAEWPAPDQVGYDSKKTARTLIRAVCWYVEQFKDDALKTVRLANGRAAIEVAYAVKLSNGAKLCSKPDALVEFEPKVVYVRERKSTGGALNSQYDAQWSPNLQITVQSIIGESVLMEQARSAGWKFRGVVLEAVQLGVNFIRVSRNFHTRTADQLASARAQLEYWTGEFMKRLSKIPAIDDHTALDKSWPQNEASCGADYGCSFRSICRVAAADRTRVIAQDFRQREKPWNPEAYERVG